MSIRELIVAIEEYRLIVAGVLAAAPVLTLLISFLHDRGDITTSPWRYAYALLVYVTTIPGMFAAILTGYSLLFLNANLLDVSAVIYFLPILSMVGTLMIMGRRVELDQVPGFNRLSGLMVLLGLSFIILFALSRTRIWLFFGGGFSALLAIGALAFGLLKWGGYMAFRRRDEPAIDPPI